jgi:hypothetical protein
MKNWLAYSLLFIALAGYFGLMAWWLWAQWDECRSMGLSVFYCIKHVL